MEDHYWKPWFYVYVQSRHSTKIHVLRILEEYSFFTNVSQPLRSSLDYYNIREQGEATSVIQQCNVYKSTMISVRILQPGHSTDPVTLENSWCAAILEVNALFS